MKKQNKCREWEISLHWNFFYVFHRLEQGQTNYESKASKRNICWSIKTSQKEITWCWSSLLAVFSYGQQKCLDQISRYSQTFDLSRIKILNFIDILWSILLLLLLDPFKLIASIVDQYSSLDTQVDDSDHQIPRDPTGNRWKMEAVFRPEIVRFLSGGFLCFPAGTGRNTASTKSPELSGTSSFRTELFDVGILN